MNKFEYKVSGAIFTDDDVEAIMWTVKKHQFTEWTIAKRFARLLSSTMQTRYSILVNSGSSANLLAVTSCKDLYKSPKGSKVITCATAFPTTVAPIIQNGLIPLFIDINPETLTYNVSQIRNLLERDDVCGVMLAHNLGIPFSSDVIADLANHLGKWFVEDCCDALGATVANRSVGSFGDASTLSFFPAHHITTGEGGSVHTSNPKLYRLLQQYSNWGRDCWCEPGQDNTCNKRFEHSWPNLPDGFDHKYTFTKVGYNLKMTEMQAALGESQLLRMPDGGAEFRRERYKMLLEVFEPFTHLKTIPLAVGASPFGFPVICEDGLAKRALVSYLEMNGVRTRPVFSGNITRHPMANEFEYEVDGELVGSDAVMNKMFWIGCWPGVNQNHMMELERLLKTYFE